MTRIKYDSIIQVIRAQMNGNNSNRWFPRESMEEHQPSTSVWRSSMPLFRHALRGLDDAGFYLKHKNDIEKMALVGEQKWIVVSMKVFVHFMRGDAKTFSGEELQEARAWIEA